MKRKIGFWGCFFIFFFSCTPSKSPKEIKKFNLETITNIDEAISFYKNSKNIVPDSVHSKNLLKLVAFSYKSKNWDLFHKFRLEQIKNNSFSNYKNTTASILDYSGAYFRNQHQQDSAYYYYYNSFKIYDQLKDSIYAGNMLLNIAIIQKNISAYKESETTSFKALKYFKNSNQQRRIASLYNNLGIIYKELNDFTNSLKYHKKSFKIRKKLKNSFLEIVSLNNIGNVYKDLKEYDKAIINYKKALGFDSILKNKPLTKAMIIDNYGFALFLKKENKNLPTLFYDALKIRDSLKDISGCIVSNFRLGMFYKSLGNNNTAINYLETAKKLSKSIQYTKDELDAMELLIDLYPLEKGLTTSKEILFKKDSLIRQERKITESISRIQFETEEKENIILLQEKELQKNKLNNNRKTIIILLLIILFVLCLVTYFIFRFYKFKEKQKFKDGFSSYLKKKYSLTETNFEFWEKLKEGHSQEELSKILFLSIDGVKSRRKALFSKIKKTKKINTNFNKSKAIILYKEELDLFKNSTLK